MLRIEDCTRGAVVASPEDEVFVVLGTVLHVSTDLTYFVELIPYPVTALPSRPRHTLIFRHAAHFAAWRPVTHLAWVSKPPERPV